MDLLIGQLIVKDTVDHDDSLWTITIDDDYHYGFMDQFVDLHKGTVAIYYGKIEHILAVKGTIVVSEFVNIPEPVIKKILELRKYLEDNSGKFRIIVDDGS